jgi:(p)ppGpp synthase/HD superfamily hydrolase
MAKFFIKAKEIATKAHQGQTRWDGSPYITHPIRVAEKVAQLWPDNEKLKIAAILHDVVEDTNLTCEDLKNYSIPLDVIHAINLLTRKNNKSYKSFILRLLSDNIARRTKIADIYDNISDAPKDAEHYKKWESLRKKRYLPALKLLETVENYVDGPFELQIHPIKDELAQLVLNAYHAGHSIDEIANALGVRKTVADTLLFRATRLKLIPEN